MKAFPSRTRRYFVFCFLFLSLLLSSCEKSEPPPSKPTVLVSVSPYLYFVKRIAGDTVTARSLIPSGVNPHVYEPTPKQVQQFQKAVLWFRLGEPSEKKTYTIFKNQNQQMRIVDITEAIALLPLCESPHAIERADAHCPHREIGKDLHIWLSLRLAQQQARTIASHLCDLFPQYQKMYEERLAHFITELKDMDRKVSLLLSEKKGKAILVSHPALAYFCRDYQLIQLSIEIEGKEPLPQDITYMLKMAKEYKVTNVLVEPQYSDKGAQLIAQCLGLPIDKIDPYADDYLNNIQSIAEVIAK